MTTLPMQAIQTRWRRWFHVGFPFSQSTYTRTSIYSRGNVAQIELIYTILQISSYACAQTTIDYLKVDVEDAEWESVEAMYKTNILQKRVKQFGFEIHYSSHSRKTGGFYRRWKILKQLEDIGFRRWYWHYNHNGAYRHKGRFRSCCYEMVYINTAFMNGK